MAWFVSSEMPPHAPVMSAAATSPVSPGSAALMRSLIRPRKASIAAHALRSRSGGGAPASGAILVVA